MPVEQLKTWASREGPVFGLALFRVVVGLMTLRYIVGFARDWASEGFYGDYFFLPYTPLIPQPSETLYIIVLAAGALGAAALVVGFHTRIAAVATLVIVAYHFSLNQIWHRHYRYFLVLCLLLVCLGPAWRALSFDARRRNLLPMGPLWTGFLIKAQMTLIYLASAVSKTLDPEWRAGAALAGRGMEITWALVMPGFVLDIVPPEAGVRLLTTLALVSEFVLPVLLWFRPTRRLAIWLGVLFHGYIELQYSATTFSYLTLATYFVFADLKCGEKRWVYSSRNAFSVRMARMISWLDWLFQIRLEAYAGTRQRFIDRDGTPYGGAMGWIMLGANLPVFYPICYPLSWLRFLRLGRCRFSIISGPAEPGRSFPASWIGVCMVLYLIYLAPAAIQARLFETGQALRFWDLPWFFVLMCLIAGTYRAKLMRDLPHREPIADAVGPPTVEPAPAGR